MVNAGEQLKYWREKKNESQEEIGKVIGKSRFAVSNRERGKVKIPLDERQKLIQHFNIPKYKQKDFL